MLSFQANAYLTEIGIQWQVEIDRYNKHLSPFTFCDSMKLYVCISLTEYENKTSLSYFLSGKLHILYVMCYLPFNQ